MTNGSYTIITGDCMDGLAALPEKHFHCVVTSPPYFALRDYGVAGQIGLEATPAEFVACMVRVFAAVWRVLRDDGVCFVNLGDSYASGGCGISERRVEMVGVKQATGQALGPKKAPPGYKPKDLLLIPHRTLIALQEWGWTVRDDIVWAKPSPMPGSQRDRCTSSYEHIFQLTKGQWSDGISPTPMSKEDAAWLAALIDGEGTITIRRGKKERTRDVFSASISIANSCKPLLDRASSIIGEGSTVKSRDALTTRRQMFSYQIANRRAASVMLAVRPYLIAKGLQADVAMSCQMFNRYYGGRDEQRYPQADYEYKRWCWETIKELNQGRSPDLSALRPAKVRKPHGCKYYWDMEAVKEPCDTPWHAVDGWREGNLDNNHKPARYLNEARNAATRIPRNVWRIASEGYGGCHFATFPTELPRRCIKAATSEKGCCPECGAPWVRVVDTDRALEAGRKSWGCGVKTTGIGPVEGVSTLHHNINTRTIGWEPGCECAPTEHAAEVRRVPCRVLDCFGGAGTTAIAACQLGRDCTLIELNPDYVEMARTRIDKALKGDLYRSDDVMDAPLFEGVQ